MASSVDMDVSHEEIERISKALKDEKFRQLFIDYAQEISDPENRKKYEEEIAQLERNRGTDVVFVHPEPGYVMKTNADGEKKAFINVCKSDKVAQPTATDVRRDNGQVGTQWTVPHSLAPGKEDLDKGGGKCMVYDCVFHPDCFQNAEKDKRFFKLMDDTAFDSIESNFGVKLDRENVKKMTKMKFKGQPRPTVIRTKSQSGPTGETDALKDFNINYPHRETDKKTDGGSNPPTKSSTKITGTRNTSNKGDTSGPIEPKYSIIHRGHFDIQHFTNAPDSMPTTRPQELIVKIQLPLLNSIATVQLEVFKKQIILECRKPVSYKLDLSLPYPVDEEKGGAKFDKSKSCLTITLPVLPPEIPKLPSFAPEPQKASLIAEMPQTMKVEEEPRKGLSNPVDGDSVGVITSRTEATKQAATSTNMEGYSTLVDESRTCTSNKGIDDSPRKKKHDNEYSQLAQEGSTPEQDGSQVSKEDTITNKASHIVPAKTASDVWCPTYIFRQDDTTASFILQVADVDVDSLQKQISDDGTTVALKFRSKTSISGEAVMVPYAFCLVLESECQIKEMEVNVQTTEAVVLLEKSATSQGEWSSFKAGVSLQELEDKLFLTEENVRDHLNDMTRKRKGKRPGSDSVHDGMDCGVIEASENKLVIELEAKVNGDAPMEDEMSDAALGAVTDTVIDAVIGELSNTAASLTLEVGHDDSSLGSDTSGPSTPCSPSGLRSALKDGHHSRRKHRSVSFSEDVVVETVVSSSPRKSKGKNKRHQPERHRRFITKLRDKSQNQGTCSDSEVHYWGGNKAEEDEEELFQEEVVFPEWVCLDRQTSSDSSGGESGAVAPDPNKKKKPKANKRQRKKMNAAKRAMAFIDDDGGMKEAWFEPRHPLRATSSEGSLSTSKTNTGNAFKGLKEPSVDQNRNHEQSPTNDGSEDQVKSKIESRDEDVHDKVNVKQEDEKVPLEMQDHRTHSAVAFSNEVMLELDE